MAVDTLNTHTFIHLRLFERASGRNKRHLYRLILMLLVCVLQGAAGLKGGEGLPGVAGLIVSS